MFIIILVYVNFTTVISRRGEIHYKLTGQGLNEFIDQGVSPEEFWIAMAWFCELSKINNDEFESYYSLFAQKYTGSSNFHGCFFQTEFFDHVFKKWQKDSKNDNQEFSLPQYVFEHPACENESAISQKVLECLALNRSITVDEIAKIVKASKEKVNRVLENYTLTAEQLN